MYKCVFCGFTSDNLDDFEEDFTNHAGFWCPYCDGFTYYEQEKRSYILFLEDKNKAEHHKKLPFSTHCSPLRYPGGKSKLIGTVLEHCRKENMEKFVEPFAGGASVGLSLLLAGKIEQLYLNDADFGVYSLFYMIKHNSDRLKQKICAFTPSKEEYKQAQKVVLSHYEACDTEEAAWALLVTNRLAFSGIPFANCMSNPVARWNPKTLCKRINAISAFADHIHVTNMDAVKFIEEMYWRNNTTIFMDPPYYEKGNVLYPTSYTEKNHKQLAFLLDELHKGCPGADMLITYDLQEEVRDMYHWPDELIIGRRYSIAN